MFSLAILVGSLAYFILLLGTFGWLKIALVKGVSLVWLMVFGVWLWQRRGKFDSLVRLFFEDKVTKISGLLLLVAIVINLIGALGPEINFDSLWYHLTLPKVYLMRERVEIFPNRPFYHSALPRFTEMLFVPALVFGGETGAKSVHFLFGVLTAGLIINYGRRWLGKKGAILAALIFYTDLSVLWLSQSAYVDLGRTFFETLAFFWLLSWWQNQENRGLVRIGVALGIATGTKLFAWGTVGVVSLMVLVLSKRRRWVDALTVIFSAVILGGVWLILAYKVTGNPIYPLFNPVLVETRQIQWPSLTQFVPDFMRLSNRPLGWDSAMSPLYLVMLPVSVYVVFKKRTVLVIGLYCLLTYVVWFLIPRIGGSRFMVPYLPAWALVSTSFLMLVGKSVKNMKLTMVGFIFLVAIGNLMIRGYLNLKYLSVILGQQDKREFLANNVDLSYVFVDVDGWFERNVTASDNVLIIGGHSLYYVNFPFIHESFYQGEPVSAVLTHNVQLPERYKVWQMVYDNPTTKVRLFKPSK